MTEATIVKMDPRDPDLSRIREIARGTREGKIVAFPTETVYGIGAPMSTRGVSERLAQIKNRPADKPFTFHIGNWEMLDFLAVKRTPAFRFLARKFWPGPLTLITHTVEGRVVGLRFPSNRLATTLINASGEPFIATSANLSGEPSPYNAKAVLDSLQTEIDFIIDGGETELKEDSTIVDMTGETPVIVRKGAREAEVQQALDQVQSGKFIRKKVLVVCTGNSCRSPMADGWIREELKRKGLDQEIAVDSCGIGAHDGMPATPEAVFVTKNHEIDISDHRSRACTREDIVESDAIIAMGKNHYTFIIGMLPAAREKIKVFNVTDPIGCSLRVYEKVYEDIERKLEDAWDWIVA